jgi:hypothetical protein
MQKTYVGRTERKKMTILVIFLYEKKKITVVLSGSIRLMVTPVSYSDTFFIKFWITYVY